MLPGAGFIEPLMRRQSSKAYTMKYEEHRPLIVNERRSLDAVGEPRLIRPMSILIAVATNTAFTRVSFRGCSYAFVIPAHNDRITAF